MGATEFRGVLFGVGEVFSWRPTGFVFTRWVYLGLACFGGAEKEAPDIYEMAFRCRLLQRLASLGFGRFAMGIFWCSGWRFSKIGYGSRWSPGGRRVWFAGFWSVGLFLRVSCF